MFILTGMDKHGHKMKNSICALFVDSTSNQLPFATSYSVVAESFFKLWKQFWPLEKVFYLMYIYYTGKWVWE